MNRIWFVHRREDALINSLFFGCVFRSCGLYNSGLMGMHKEKIFELLVQ